MSAQQAPVDDFAWLDAVAQAELVRSRQATAAELTEAAIERIERVNPRLNFLVAPLFEEALERARQSSSPGPLGGVPMLIKDHLATVAGAPYTSGSRYLGSYVADRDSELVSRYRAAGLIPLGTSATCELALLSTTEPARYGPCSNPWDPGRTTGGSSGGSAAAVAAGCVPVAHGNDSGGSIRIPASCCGLFGLKPSRGRNPLGPRFGDLAGGLWCEHVVTRSVRDSAAVLDATCGPMPGDPYAAPPARGPYREETRLDPGKLRIALSTRAPTSVDVDPDCVAAVESAAALCEDLGHSVIEADLPVDAGAMEEAFSVVIAASTAATLTDWERRLGRPPAAGDLEPFTRALVGVGREQSAADYLLAVQALQLASRAIAGGFDGYEVRLSPTLAAPPVPLGFFDPRGGEPLEVLRRDAGFAAFTWVANATGQPSASVPLHWNRDGLPIGVLFDAPVGREDLLLRLGAQLERGRPWAGRRPGVSAGLG